MFADVEAVLVTYLAATPGVSGASVELPQKVLGQLPFVLVTRSGGSDDYITDSALVDVEVFGSTRALASASARTVHARMLLLRHTAVNGTLIDRVETLTGPMWVNYGDENLQRYVMTYVIDSRIISALS